MIGLRYGCYNDDILLVWRQDVAPIQRFLEYLNSNDCNLKLTGQWDPVSVNFLDITLRGNPTTGKVETSLYRKPTAGNTLLHADSYHTPHTIAAVPYGELIRARRSCSENCDFIVEKEVIKNRLRRIGYKDKMLEKAEKPINGVVRLDLLKDKDPNSDTVVNSSLVFSTPYNKDLNEIRKIIFKHVPILNSNDKLSTVREGGVKMMAKRNGTLGDALSPSLFFLPASHRRALG